MGGQDSPGPAYAALSKRHALSFGNRLKSSNSMIKLQENQARKYNEYKKNSEDPDQLIQQTLKTIKQRAQSASPMRKDLVGNRPPSATTPFSRSLNNQRPVSAHSSPDIRIYTPTSSSSSSSTAAATSRRRNTIRDRGRSSKRHQAKHSPPQKQRPTSASPGPKSPSNQKRRRPASSKLVRRSSSGIRQTLLPVNNNEDEQDLNCYSTDAYEDDFEPPMSSSSYAAATLPPSNSRINVDQDDEYIDDDDDVDDVDDVDALMGPTISSPTLMKKASASELHLQKLLDKQKRKQKRRKLKADLRRALAGVEKAANKARIAANRVLKKN